MQTLVAFFSAILDGLRALVGLILPVFAEAADFRHWPKWLKVLVGLLLALGLAYLAYHVQRWTGLDSLLGDVVRDFKPFFLPALVLLVIAFSWLLYALWAVLTGDEGTAEFPDIAAAWTEATRRLSKAGLAPADAPLYLVLGRPAAGNDAMFLAAGVKDIIRTPSSGEPPLRVYAWNEAIYVTCEGSSSWGAFCTRLTGEDETAWVGGAVAPEPGAREALGITFEGLDPALRAEMDALVRASKERDLGPAEQNRLRFLAEQAAGVAPPSARRKLGMPETQLAEAVRRLQFLCRLIRRDRRPWCPINGLVVLVPWAATETDDAVRIASGVLQRELNATRSALQLRYPTYAVVCDLETARGFAEFRSGFPAELLRQRIGQRLPLGPDVDPPSVPGVVASAVQWIGLAVLPAWIHRFLQLDHRPDPGGSPTGGSPHNRNLYRLMRAMFERAPRLAQLLSRGLPPVQGPVGDPATGLPLFAGCYLAGTGETPDGQAFVPGIFQRVTDGQDLVSWAPEATAEDARLDRLTTLGYVGIVLLLLATIVALRLWWSSVG
jgi:hypothetical protein